MTIRTITTPAGTSKQNLEILRAAIAGEEGSRAKVSDLLAREPVWIERIGTLASSAEDAVLSLAKGQVVIEEAWRAEMNGMRSSLAQPGDGALEGCLIERVVLCWLALTLAELKRARRWQDLVSPEIGDFWDRHVSRLHGDFLRASKTLASVRRLRLPALQVNVGGQQVNIAG